MLGGGLADCFKVTGISRSRGEKLNHVCGMFAEVYKLLKRRMVEGEAGNINLGSSCDGP